MNKKKIQSRDFWKSEGQIVLRKIAVWKTYKMRRRGRSRRRWGLYRVREAPIGIRDGDVVKAAMDPARCGINQKKNKYALVRIN